MWLPLWDNLVLIAWEHATKLLQDLHMCRRSIAESFGKLTNLCLRCGRTSSLMPCTLDLWLKRSNIKCCGVTGDTSTSQPAGGTIPLAALSYRYRDKRQQIWISPIASKSYLYCRPKSYFSCFAAYEKRPANRGTLWIFWQIRDIICQRGIWSNSFVCYVDLLPNIL